MEMFSYPVPSLSELVHEAHNVERVHTVDDGGPQVSTTEHAGQVSTLRYRLQFVFTPCVQFVVVPRVTHHLKRLTIVEKGFALELGVTDPIIWLKPAVNK